MEYNQTETLKPNEEKGLIPADYNDTLETAMQEIGALRNEVNALDSKVDGLDTSVNTQSVNAQSVSGQTITGNSVSATTLTGNEVNAGEVNTATLNASGKASVKQLEVNDDIKADSAEIDDIVSNNVKTGTLEATTLNVNDFNVDNLDVNDIDADDITSNKLTASQAAVDDATITNADIQEADIQDADIDTLDVTDTLNAKDVNVSGDLTVEDFMGKEAKAGDFTFNSSSGNAIAITEDSFIGIKPAVSSEVRFILKDSSNHNLLTGKVGINEPENGRPTLEVSFYQKDSLSDIFVDTDGNLWFKLEPGIRGTLYFATFGMEKIIPETDSVVNPPFDTTTAEHYVVTEDSGIIVFSLTNLIIDSEVEVTKDTVFHGNVRVEGVLSISSLEAEHAKYLGESEYVTADENGVIESKGISVDGDAGVKGNLDVDVDANVDGDLTVGGDITATGDLSADDVSANSVTTTGDATVGGNASVTGNAAVGGDLSVTGTINGNLSGSVTGDVTGNLTGNVTGNASGNAGSADKWKTPRNFRIKDYSGTNSGSYTSIDGSGDKDLKLPQNIVANITGNVTGNVTGDVTGNVTGDLTGTASKATGDENGLNIASNYAKKAEINTEIEARVKARGYSSVIGTALASQIVSILQDGTYTVDGETYYVGENPLFVGEFTISQDITLSSGIHSINGLGCNISHPEVLYPNAEYTKLDFGNHKLTVSSSGIQFTNVHLKNTVMAVTGYGVLYINAYCANLENISTSILVNEELYFQLKKSTFKDSSNSYTDGPRYFRNCEDSTITVKNKDDTTAQKTALFNCQGCTFNLFLDKKLGSGTNNYTLCPCIIDGLFDCTVNYEARYLYTNDVFQCGIAPNEIFTFYQKIKPYHAKNCSFFVDFRYFNTTLPSGASISGFDYGMVFRIMAVGSIESSMNLDGAPESIVDCTIKLRDDGSHSPYKKLMGGKYIAGYNSYNGIMNFNRNTIFVKGNFGTSSGFLFGAGTMYGIQDNTYMLDMSLTWFSFGDQTFTTVFGFRNNNFFHKKQSGESAFDPWSNALVQAQKFYCVLPPSNDLATGVTSDVSGLTKVFASTAKYTFWMGENSFNSY